MNFVANPTTGRPFPGCALHIDIGHGLRRPLSDWYTLPDHEGGHVYIPCAGGGGITVTSEDARRLRREFRATIHRSRHSLVLV